MALTDAQKYDIADKVVDNLLSNGFALDEFTSKTKEQQYGQLFSFRIKGETFEQKFGEEDGPHIIGLIRHRLINPPVDLDIDF